MAGGFNKLSSRKVAAMAPGDAPLSDGGGLRVSINGGGSKRWIWRFSLNNQKASISCGGNTVTLAEARTTRDKYKGLVDRGIDPRSQVAKPDVKQARVDKTSVTFGEFAQEWFEQVKAPTLKQTGDAKRKNANWLNMVRDHGADFWGQPFEAITIETVASSMRELNDAHPSTWKRCINRCQQIYDAAEGRKLAPADKINPFLTSKLKHYIRIPKKGKDFEQRPWPAMEFEQAPAFFQWCGQKGYVSNLALQWLMLSATRSQEARGALWGEVDFRRKLWIVQATRMKAANDHIISLPPTLKEFLKAVPRRGDSELIFPGLHRSQGKYGLISDTALRKQLQMYCETYDLWDVMGTNRRPSLHGFRTTFKLWSIDQEIPEEYSEAQLSHKGDAVAERYKAGYTYDKQRGDVLERWAQYLHGRKSLFDQG